MALAAHGRTPTAARVASQPPMQHTGWLCRIHPHQPVAMAPTVNPCHKESLVSRCSHANIVQSSTYARWAVQTRPHHVQHQPTQVAKLWNMVKGGRRQRHPSSTCNRLSGCRMPAILYILPCKGVQFRPVWMCCSAAAPTPSQNATAGCGDHHWPALPTHGCVRSEQVPGLCPPRCDSQGTLLLDCDSAAGNTLQRSYCVPHHALPLSSSRHSLQHAGNTPPQATCAAGGT